jgi:hypothetical protein
VETASENGKRIMENGKWKMGGKEKVPRGAGAHFL